MEIHADMTIMEVLQAKPAAAEVFQEMGMHCLGCAMARGETVGQAAEVHGHDVNEIIEKINAIEE